MTPAPTKSGSGRGQREFRERHRRIHKAVTVAASNHYYDANIAATSGIEAALENTDRQAQRIAELQEILRLLEPIKGKRPRQRPRKARPPPHDMPGGTAPVRVP